MQDGIVMRTNGRLLSMLTRTSKLNPLKQKYEFGKRFLKSSGFLSDYFQSLLRRFLWFGIRGRCNAGKEPVALDTYSRTWKRLLLKIYKLDEKPVNSKNF